MIKSLLPPELQYQQFKNLQTGAGFAPCQPDCIDTIKHENIFSWNLNVFANSDPKLNICILSIIILYVGV